jgi:hypothetical protein
MTTLLWERVYENIIDRKKHEGPFNHSSKIMRAKVPGGWLVRALEIIKGSVGFIFIHYPDHTCE